MNHLSFIERLRAWLALLPLLLLLGATYWLNQQVQPLPPKPDDSKRHDPDYIIDNLSATTLNEQGVPHYIMGAQKMLHYPDDDSTHMEEPQLTSLYPDRPAVHVSARHGKISGEGDQVFLYDDVKVVRDATATQSEMTFTSSYLHVLPDNDLADTDRPVTIIDDSNVVHAIGMKLNNRTGVIQLLAQVNSQHETAKR
ncbi:MAG: LPS export ABC transporter periplasmic protein LptC [Sideroxydans sp.]|nr:LPS export ABC transporter periplasmic protein LptC [Sideroxydans sp.]